MEAKEFNRLVKEIKRNEQAIEKLYLIYYPRAIKHFSSKYGRPLSEDATQEFFLHLLDISEQLEFINNPTGWVYACIENKIKRRIKFESRYCALAETVASANTMEFVEKEIYSDQLLKNLKPLEQKIIYLIYWEGYSRKEVADILHLTPVNVRQIYSRALKKIRNKI